MGGEWTALPLEECMEAIIDYRGKTPQKTSSGVPLITAKIIKDGAIQPITEFIAEDEYDSWMRRGIPKSGDIVMTTEAPLGEIAQLDDRKVALAQRVITLRGKTGLLDNTFLKYLMISHDVQHQLDGRGTGTTVKGIKQSELRQVTLSFPPFVEQKSIAHILGTLDDKIELSRQMNATLEAMAQALFKSWFVDFDPVIDNALAAGNPIPEPLYARAKVRAALGDKRKPLPEAIQKQFPSSFVFSEEMGWIPEGWEIQRVYDVTENVFSGGTPNTNTEMYWNGELNWFSSGETREFLVTSTEKTITPLGVSESSTKLAGYGDILIASAGQGLTRGQSSFCTIETYINQSVVCVRPLAEMHRAWLFFNLYGRYEEMRGLSDSHSIRGSLTTKLVKGMRVLTPTAEVLESYEGWVSAHLIKIKAALIEMKQLGELRDTLLPKLLSGQLCIPMPRNLSRM